MIIIVGEIKDLQQKIWDEAAREENIQTSNSTPCPAAVACTLFHKASQTCSAHFFKPSVSRLKFDTHLKQAQSKRSVACPTCFLPNPSDLTENFFATFLSENGAVQSYREALKFQVKSTFNGVFYRGKFDKNSNSFEKKIGTGELNCGGELMHGTDSLFVRSTPNGSPIQVLFLILEEKYNITTELYDK